MNQTFEYQLPNSDYKFNIELPSELNKKIINLVFDNQSIQIIIENDKIKISNNK